MPGSKHAFARGSRLRFYWTERGGWSREAWRPGSAPCSACSDPDWNSKPLVGRKLALLWRDRSDCVKVLQGGRRWARGARRARFGEDVPHSHLPQPLPARHPDPQPEAASLQDVLLRHIESFPTSCSLKPRFPNLVIMGVLARIIAGCGAALGVLEGTGQRRFYPLGASGPFPSYRLPEGLWVGPNVPWKPEGTCKGSSFMGPCER